MNIKDFRKKQIQINMSLGIKNKTTEIIKKDYSKKISKSKENAELIAAAFQPAKETLIVAPTGSGKTYSINEVFKILNDEAAAKLDFITSGTITDDIKEVFEGFSEEEIRKYLLDAEPQIVNIILCPNRVQNLQNSISYNMKALVGDAKGLLEYDLKKENNFSAVYDKINDLLDILKNKFSKTKINLVIDEAHLLIESSDYRKCIKDINVITEEILNNGGSVVYMTATIEPLIIKQFDKIIEFNDVSYKANADRLVIKRNKSNAPFDKFVYKVIKDQTDNKLIPFIRLNSFNMTDKVFQDLVFEDNKNVITVNSKDKGYTTYTDNTTGKEITTYNNKMYNDIISNNSLPGIINEKPVDAYATTSMVEVGSNITGIDGKQNKGLNPMFLCPDTKQMSINAAIQFFNRVRYSVNEYDFLIPYKTPDYKFKSIDWLVYNDYGFLQRILESFQDGLQAIRIRTTNRREIINQMNQQFSNTNIYGQRNDLNCIYLNEDTLKIEVDLNMFWKNCYDKYIRQYFYHQDKLKERLEEELGIKVIIEDIEDVKEEDLKTDNEVCSILGQALINNEMKDEITSGYITNPALLSIKRHSLFKEVLELLRYGFNIEDALSLVLSQDEKTINKYKKEKIKSILRSFNNQEKAIFKKVLNGDMKVSDIQNDKLGKDIYTVFKNDLYIAAFNKADKKQIDFDNIYDVISNCSKDADIKNYILNEQYKIYNQFYLTSNYDLMMGSAGKEQKVILDKLLNYNMSGNVKQTELTKAVLKDMKDTLNKTLKTGYTEKEVKKLIKNCFIIRKTKNGEAILNLR